MAPKLSSRQQAQLAYLELLPPKLQRIYSVVEQMAAPRVDEALIRGLGRLLDDIKGNAASLSSLRPMRRCMTLRSRSAISE